MSGTPNRENGHIEADVDATQTSPSASGSQSFDRLAGQEDPGIIREFIQFLKYNKKWSLTPIFIVTLLLIGAAILLPSPVAPFIYTLF